MARTPAWPADAEVQRPLQWQNKQTLLRISGVPAADQPFGLAPLRYVGTSSDDGRTWTTVTTTGAAPLLATVVALPNGTLMGADAKGRLLRGRGGSFSLDPGLIGHVTAVAGNEARTWAVINESQLWSQRTGDTNWKRVPLPE